MGGSGESVGERLKRLRLERKLTQTELAAPEYSAAYVSTIESGKRRPTRGPIRHFARKLGVSEEELLSGTPPELPIELEISLQTSHAHLFRGEHAQALEGFKAVAAEAEKHGFARIQAKALEGEARVVEREGHAQDALKLFGAALRLLAGEAPTRRAEAVAGEARCQQMLGNVRLAIHLLESYLLDLEKAGLNDPVALMRTYSALIWPLSEVGLHDQAARAAEEALRYEVQVKDPAEVAAMHMNVARELLRQGKIEDALLSLQRAEDLYRTLGWRSELARAHANRAMVLASQGDLAGARAENVLALELVRGTRYKLSAARALNELGRIERLDGDIEAAKRALGEALSLLQESDVKELALTHRELGLCEAAGGAVETADEHLRSAIAFFRRAEDPVEVAATYRHLGDVLAGAGREDGAREAYREGLLSLEGVPAA